jgi:signal transduction histidine kinase
MSYSAFLLSPDDALLHMVGSVLGEMDVPYHEVELVEELVDRVGRSALLFLPLDKASTSDLLALRYRLPSVDVVAVAHEGTPQEATEAMRSGAMDYLWPPLDQERVRQAVVQWKDRSTEVTEAERLSEIISLMELGRTLTSKLRLDELYDQVIEQVQRTFLPDTVSLMLLTDEGDRLRLVAQRGLNAGARPGTEVTVEESIAGLVLRERRPQLLPGGLHGTVFENMRRRGSNIGSAMSIPLTTQRETLGVLNVSRRQGRPSYSEDDANLLHVFASQIAIALKNAYLYESLREERDRIIKAQETVRRELARDLHDGLAQVLAALAFSLDHLRMLLQNGNIGPERVLEELDFLRGTARQAIHDTRTLTFGLRPLVLETQGILPALQQFLASVRESDKQTIYHLAHTTFPSAAHLSPTVARMVFGILQEAINNARKHARAKNIWIRLGYREEGSRSYITASVRDDGSGFNVKQIEQNYDQRYSFGLVNIKERAALIDATLTIDSGEHGTIVQIEVPWRDEGVP